MSRRGKAVLLAGMMAMSLGAAAAQTQRPLPETVHCSLEGETHTCSRAVLLKAVAEAHTVTVESQPKDRMAEGQLATLAKNLTKEMAPAGTPGDITLSLVRTNDTGMSVGSFDVDLGTLRVFLAGSGGTGRRLLWVERYRGQQDVPWQSIVRALTGQLQRTLAGR